MQEPLFEQHRLTRDSGLHRGAAILISCRAVGGKKTKQKSVPNVIAF